MRLLLVDDHALFREGLRSLLAYHADLTVVGEAETAQAAVEQARRLLPDLVLMDIDLPGEDGIVATRRLKAELPELRVVILTVFDDAGKLFDAVKAGAEGYLVKNIRSTELVEQLRGLGRGEAAIDRRMAGRILEEFRRHEDVVGPEAELSSRELEVLGLVAARLANKEIAARLLISENTVKNHLKSILRKLHLRSRRQAAAYGVARGWIRPGSGGPAGERYE
jgi:two-component system nitrate/nitrite response regulator NarL